MPANIISVQLGQCGNQVGAQFFRTLAEEAAATSDEDARSILQETFFRPPDRRLQQGRPVARAVLIDMEPKVINAALKAAARSASAWTYNPAGTCTFQSGSGNNWARGYAVFGPRFADAISDLVRKEAEACDRLGGFLLLQSMAGGTGAGLGAYTAEALRDEYPSSFLLSHCVWPYESGEVIVQSYNTLLTLASLLDCADGVILSENAQLHACAAQLFGVARPAFQDLNEIASHALASALLPAAWRLAAPPPPGHAAAAAAAPPRHAQLMGDLVARLCPHPQLRMLSLYSCPQIPPKSVDFTTFAWPALTKRLRQMVATGSPLEEGLDWSVLHDPPGGGADAALPRRAANRCLANAVFLHGKDAAMADVSALADPQLYAPWSPQPLSVAHSAFRVRRYEMAATVLSNGVAAALPPRRMLERAYAMYGTRAYVHQYAAHGIGEEYLEGAFGRVEEMAAAYGTLLTGLGGSSGIG